MADYLPLADEHRTVTKSSIAQHKGDTLTVFRAGEHIPLVFDQIDYIDCDKIVSHRATVTDSSELPYEYPVGHCTYLSDLYVTLDKEGEEIKKLPCWFGDGWYREYVNTRTYVNFDDQAFGIRNAQHVDIGLHYVEAIDTLV